MKKIFFFFLLCCNYAMAQYTYTLRIMNTEGQPMKSVLVTAHNNDTNTELKATTDQTGAAVFDLSEVGVYSFSYLTAKNAATFEVKEGRSGKGSMTTTYDPEGVFAEQPKFNRTGIVFATFASQDLKDKPGATKVTIEVKEKNGSVVSNQPLELCSGKDKAKYRGITNAAGQAVFYLPVNREYEIDIGGIEAIQKLDVSAKPNVSYRQLVYYEKTNVKETVKGDTIYQSNVLQTAGTSSHLLFTLALKDYEGKPLENEPVYIDAQKGKAVYIGNTDKEGACKFMLLKGSEYLVNLKYERGIHLIDATKTVGFGSSSVSRKYRGSKAIEKMMAERKMNKDGFVTNHAETPVSKADKPTDYLKKTANGFVVDFGSAGPVGTPTVADNKLFTQEGYYSPDFHCLDANTGQHLWSVQLGESGMSPAVFHEGVLLVNTYSCTLYALEAATGKLLWSKWLAGTIYSTPSADGSSVYVVYNNGGSNPLHQDESFVLTSFDLRTGKMNWINWVDTEVIACPVIEGNEVHLASQSGNYYVFNKETGKSVVSSRSVKAISSPVITADAIYITANVNGKEQLTVLDRNTLKVKKTYATPTAFAAVVTAHKTAYESMNFNGSHPVVYKNKIFVLESERLTVFDAVTEKVVWQQSLKAHANQVPVAAGNKVIVATASGDVVAYDVNTGAAQVMQKNEGVAEGQPVSSNGAMYIAGDGGVQVYKTAQNYKWGQWNKDARRNLNYE